jgi:O-antigen ligase
MSANMPTLIQSLIGWTVLILIFFSIIFSGANSPTYWTLMALAVFILFIFQGMLFLYRGEIKLNHSILIPGTLYIIALVWCWVQASPQFGQLAPHPIWLVTGEKNPYISASPVDSSHGIMRLGAYGMVFWIALQSSLNKDRAFSFIKAIAIFLTGLSLYGLYAFFSGSANLLGGEAHKVVRATFVNRNSYATLAAFGLLANTTIYYWLINARAASGHSTRSTIRSFLESFFSGAWIYLLGSILNISALLLTSSRAGTISGLAGLMVLLTLIHQRGKRLRLGLVSVIVLVTPIAVVLSDNVWQRLLETEGSSLRFSVYQTILSNVSDRLLVGHGLGAFEDTFRAYVTIDFGMSEWSLAHNSYLENLWEMGLPAAMVFYLALLWVGLILTIKANTNRTQKFRPVFALSCALTAALHAGFDFSLQMPAIAAAFAFILGLGFSMDASRKTRQ